MPSQTARTPWARSSPRAPKAVMRAPPIPVPNDPFLVGASVYLQAFVSDPGAIAGWAFTPGLQVTFG